MLIFFSCTFSQAIFSGYSNVNSALTLENLEGAFYAQGFSKFPDSDFMALGLQAADVTNLKSIATTEQTHVTTLTTAIAGAGFKPVQPCTYNFGFTTAAAMVANELCRLCLTGLCLCADLRNLMFLGLDLSLTAPT